MVAALTYVGVSLSVLAILTVVYVVEDIHGRRVFLPGARAALDRLIEALLVKLTAVRRFFTHGIVRIMLHYGAHKVLNRVLSTLRRWEQKVEELVRHNRKVAKDIRSQKSQTQTHLGAIAQHKQDVALSDEEKKELKSK